MSKIAVLDTSFITNWKSPNKTKEEQEKYELFENSVKQKKIIIAIPTPVITELLSGPVKKVSNEVLGKNIKILPFDYRASIECADIFDLEGCVDKAKIIFEKQLNDCSDDLLYTAAMQQSNLPMMLTDVFKKSIKKMNDNG